MYDLVSTLGSSVRTYLTASTKLVNFLDLVFCLTKSISTHGDHLLPFLSNSTEDMSSVLFYSNNI